VYVALQEATAAATAAVKFFLFNSNNFAPSKKGGERERKGEQGLLPIN